MGASSFRVIVDQLGEASIFIGDTDVSRLADAGFELASAPGQPTRLALFSLRGGTVEGEAVAEVHHPTEPRGLAADRVRALDAAAVERIVLERQGWGTDQGQTYLDVVAELVAAP